jgi:hypothetical protein
MKTFIVSLAFFALLVRDAACQVDCTELPDGVHGWGCKGYTVCLGGNGTHVDCEDDEVFNEEIMACDDIMNVGPPCGLLRNCTNLPDARYPDLVVNCTAYFTCLDGDFKGHNPCNPGTVFHFQLQVCDYPENVLPPCGTLNATDIEEDDMKENGQGALDWLWDVLEAVAR